MVLADHSVPLTHVLCFMADRELKRRQQENSCKIIEKILMEEKLRKKSMQKTKTPSSSCYMKVNKI